MKKTIDEFDNAAGWAGTGTVTVQGLNEHDEYIANYNVASLIFSFPAGNQTETIGKTSLSIDVTGYDEIVFSTWSRSKGRRDYIKTADFNYKLSLGGGNDFYFRTFVEFTQETINISGISTITEITITALHDDEDFLLMSHMVAVADELPIDIFRSVRTLLESVRDETYPKGISIGTVNAVQDDNILEVAGDYVFRYAVLYIDDLTNTETHQLADEGEDGFTMQRTFDGRTLLNDYTAAPIYLRLPVAIGQFEKEVFLPGMVIWGMEPTPIFRANQLDAFFDTFTDTGADEVREGKIVNWRVLIDAEARHGFPLAEMTRIIRAAMSRNTLWINGRRHDIFFNEVPVEQIPTDAFQIVPKVQYTLIVELKETVWARKTRPFAGPATFTATPRLQGSAL